MSFHTSLKEIFLDPHLIEGVVVVKLLNEPTVTLSFRCFSLSLYLTLSLPLSLSVDAVHRHTPRDPPLSHVHTKSRDSSWLSLRAGRRSVSPILKQQIEEGGERGIEKVRERERGKERERGWSNG